MAKPLKIYSKGLKGYEEDDQTLVSDFLGDLRHWCDKKSVDFEEALRMSEVHYIAEMDPDDDLA